MQSYGHEFGTTTGRKRRCGWLDIPLLKHTNMVNGYHAIALTKLDILDKFNEIKIGVNYVKNGENLKYYPTSEHDFEGVTVEYVTMPGWNESIASCKTFESLPKNAQDYVKKLEQLLRIPGMNKQKIFPKMQISGFRTYVELLTFFRILT